MSMVNVIVLLACAAVNGDTAVTVVITVELDVKLELAGVHQNLLHLLLTQAVEALNVAVVDGLELIADVEEVAAMTATVLLEKTVSRT